MSLPTMHGTARLIDDPELRFGAGSGKAVVRVRLAFNSRKKDKATNEWVDGDTFFVDGKAFDQAAEHIAESLSRGMEVVVSGRLRTEKWETGQGEKRSASALLIDSIGPSLARATAKVTKVSSSGSGGQGQGRSQGRSQQGAASAEDPWASNNPGTSAGAPAGGGWGRGSQGGGYSDEPPF
ncbi:single-stranded DNA-binding protein [Streptomyces sp. rh34]|uniref:single-stranded DNA-binding protein n=1 Tax=Streptomyces sp. rh34 TaxID=2034272 RepID=UPI000BEFA10A|nr:single-stranded DNA-binding protein [Streptomyces sp. rh34]